jgi:hypothetical protein
VDSSLSSWAGMAGLCIQNTGNARVRQIAERLSRRYRLSSRQACRPMPASIESTKTIAPA